MNKLKIYLSILVVSLCCISFILQAQTLPSNLSNTNVDNITDAQIKELLQQAQASGQSDAQVIQAAQSRGLSASQAQRLQTRIDDIRKTVVNSTNTNDEDNVSGRKQTDTLPAYQQITNIKSRIFGASLFRNSTTNTFQPNLKLATPINYIVGPDDQLQINVYGNSLANWKLNVSPEGNINIPSVGLLNVSGKTIEAATAAIKSKLAANNYAIGRGTNVSVTLGDIRSINVLLQGEFVKPGTYTISSLSTVFGALFSAGGPNDIGSFRKIEVIRGDKVIKVLDLYDFLVNGTQKSNITLHDQDIVHIPTYDKRVELNGEVKIPGIFETLPKESLSDLLRFSGGFTNEAYTPRIKVIQANDRQLRIADIFEKDYKNYIPQRGDKYTVDKILDRYENRVTINGAVFRGGDFELQPNLTVSQLIKNAGGLKEDAFTGRGSITRLNADNTTQIISFNVRNVINNPSSDIVLQREDIVKIVSGFDLHDPYNVTIKGQVRKPGDFVYADSMKVADLIVMAGGFAEGASSKHVEVSRRMFNSDPRVLDSRVAQVYSVDVDADLNFENINFSLKPFDIVSVYSLPGYETQKIVKVEGEVIYPGYYTIQKKNEKISDIIVRAGGLTQSADIEGGSLRRDNDAVLGVDKTKLDAETLNRVRTDRVKRLQLTNKDSLNKIVDTSQFRNNFVGINLNKILHKSGGAEDLLLENGDILRVPKQQQTVRINGEVLYPSAVVYTRGKSLRGFVLNAGGFSSRALKRGAYVVYPNGTVKGTSKFLFFNIHPKIKPGSEIYVPKKNPSTANSAQLVLSFTTGLASLGAIILGILSLNK